MLIPFSILEIHLEFLPFMVIEAQTLKQLISKEINKEENEYMSIQRES